MRSIRGGRIALLGCFKDDLRLIALFLADLQNYAYVLRAFGVYGNRAGRFGFEAIVDTRDGDFPTSPVYSYECTGGLQNTRAASPVLVAQQASIGIL
jgi:hypothetical protein